MPVYNAWPYLDQSIGSILNQTFTDFEFIILDDASTDGSTDLLRWWAQKDKRICLYVGESNQGPSGSSNFVVQAARAPIIARMDADDISLPHRLQRQWEVIQKHPDIVLLGALSEVITSDGQRVQPRDRWRLSRRSIQPCTHGSMMFRREVFDAVGGYREECAGWEDYDLLLRIKQKGRVFILNDALYQHRCQINSISARASVMRVAQAMSLRQLSLTELSGERHHGLRLIQKQNHGQDLEALAEALYRMGYIRLWAGQSPQILNLVYEHKVFGLRPRLLRTLVLATWGTISHRSLRLFIRSVIKTRDFLASFYIKDGGMYEWQPK